MASKSRNHGESLSQADKQDAGTSRDSKKRKQIDRVEKESSQRETTSSSGIVERRRKKA